MNPQTLNQYNSILAVCREIFLKKTRDYGTSWRILRTTSLTDQLFIKAQRIRTLEEAGENKVGESIEDEFKALVNYSVIGLIQFSMDDKNVNWTEERTLEAYDKMSHETRELMLKKNHDYGEAWRDMRPSSFTDLILMKLLRVKQIEENKGQTLISEGIDANYKDIINYSIFALIKLREAKQA